MVLTQEERVFLVKNVAQNKGKFTQNVKDSFVSVFGAERLPNRNSVAALMARFDETGSVKNRSKSGRPRVADDSVLNNISNCLERSPSKSLRHLAQETGISRSVTHRVVRELKFYPYKVKVVHDRVISRGLWPPRSPDLTPLDFYLWGRLKGVVYRSNPKTIETLKRETIREISSIDEDELKRVFENLRRRVNLCVRQNGSHFQHLMRIA